MPRAGQLTADAGFEPISALQPPLNYAEGISLLNTDREAPVSRGRAGVESSTGARSNQHNCA